MIDNKIDKIIAAVLTEIGKPLVLTELKIPELKPGQALVKIAYSGVCHTQILEFKGYRGIDKFIPHCLGHEGSGYVQDIGSGVTKVKKGDRVILSWIKGSGADVNNTIYKCGNGNLDVNAGGITTFSNYSVISENRLTVIPNDIKETDLSMRDAALLGCAIPTGIGAVLNTAKPRPGQSIAIFGTGGIGLWSVVGARIAGCAPIIAIDKFYDKLKFAKDLGATDIIKVQDDDEDENGGGNKIDMVNKMINYICPGGADFAIDATGSKNVMEKVLDSVHNQGGTAVIIGNIPYGNKIEIDPRQFNNGKRILGTWGGDNNPDIDFPRYCKLIKYGIIDIFCDLLKLGLLKMYHLSDINDAISDLEAGKVIRPIIYMDDSSEFS